MVDLPNYAKLFEQGKLFRDGPFTDSDVGGMMVATQDVSRDELDSICS